MSSVAISASEHHRWAKLAFNNRRCCKVCGFIQQRRTVRGVYRWLPRLAVCPGPQPATLTKDAP